MAAPSDEPRQKSLPEHVDDESGALWEDERGLHVVDFLTNKAGDDLKSHKNIGDILESLKEENNVLSEQVNLLIRNGKNLTHLQGVQPSKNHLGRMLNQIQTIERHMKYLSCLQLIEECSSSIQQCLMTGSVWEAIRAIDSMGAVHAGLKTSGCSSLKAFLQETLSFWHRIIKDRLSGDFEKILAQLHWPNISPTAQSLAPVGNHQELSVQLELLVTQLLALQTTDNLLFHSTSPLLPTQADSSATAVSQSPICLPIQIMLLPFRKRFRYHFCGNRQTSSLSKPEWYLTQVLLWMSNNSTFMEEKIQPILEGAETHLSARVELCRGLLALVQEKVASDALRLLYDDALFCHLVEEVLQFEKELRSKLSYPPALPGLLHLLLENTVLQKWLTVEKKMAVEKMDAMLSSEGAWSCQYKEMCDMDELRAPDCAETFMMLLQVITERYRYLTCPSAQLKFLGLQKELLDDFRIRLTQVMKEDSRYPLSARYCAILNAVNYISTILRDWGDNVFFLQLQQAAVSLNDEVLLGGLGLMELGQLAALEGSLFDSLLALLDRLKGDMMGRLLDWTMREFKEKAKPYSQNRWLSFPSQQDQSSMSLSSSACPMMLCLRDRLLSLHQLLGLSLFQLTWQGLAERLDHFLYQDVILANHFSDGGAAQLHFDMSRNLFPLFGQYCKRPENFFKHVKEACIILRLSVGSAILLRNVLEEAEEETDAGDHERPTLMSTLHELGVYCLAPCDVLYVLRLRVSWPGQ
uniref:RAD50-interacting protein 1 n=1 Tax=Takifugu rubripes TaxID=31033 RepID=A0A674MVZ1_TAKRU